MTPKLPRSASADPRPGMDAGEELPALQQQLARYRRILDSARDVAIIATGLDGRITCWNQGATRIIGWQEAEMLGQSLHRIYTPEDRAQRRLENEMEGALRYGHAADERWHMDREGRRFWAVGQLNLLMDESGAVEGFVKVMRDRTAHQRADQRLQHLTQGLEQEVEQRTRERDLLWHNSMDLLLVMDGEGVVRALNPACRVQLGYADEELVGRHFMPFIHPDDLPATRSALQHAMREPLERFEVRIRHKDGSWRWFAWRAAPGQGLIYANGRDITGEKRQAELLARAQAARLDVALEAGQMGGWEWDSASGHLQWLHNARAVHGVFQPSGISHLTLAEYLHGYVHPEDHSALADSSRSALRSGAALNLEYRVIWPDGSVHWVEARARVVRDEQGQASRLVGVVVDITRRKRVEHDFQFLARASAELAQLVEPHSILERLVSLAVPLFADWCTIDLLQEDGSLKRVAARHVDPTLLAEVQNLVTDAPEPGAKPEGPWRVAATGQSWLLEESDPAVLARRIPHPGRRQTLLGLGMRSWMGVAIKTSGKTLGVISFVTSVSGRLYSPDELAIAEDLAQRVAVAIENAGLYRALREADQAKDVFLATLAHELRNPLAAIVGSLTVLSLAGPHNTRVQQGLQLMQRQSEQLTRLVNDLMDVSRISTGKVQLHRESISLQTVLHSAIESSQPFIDGGGHTLLQSLPEAPCMVQADPVRLAQVFSNLLINAAKYTNRGGRIELTLQEEGEEYAVRVRDNGIGIAPDMLRKIFHMFTQLMHPIQRSEGGLGLGLSLVEALVKLHGGRVEARSEGLGRGSEFVVHLPRVGNTEQAEAAANALTAGQRRRILVVDDNVDAAGATGDILAMLGHEVRLAHDGPAALTAAVQFQPAIVLLDIGLPGMDGYEVARRLKAAGQASPYLIAATGWGQEGDREQAAQAGFDLHWVKPLSLAQLHALASIDIDKKCDKRTDSAS